MLNDGAPNRPSEHAQLLADYLDERMMKIFLRSFLGSLLSLHVSEGLMMLPELDLTTTQCHHLNVFYR